MERECNAVWSNITQSCRNCKQSINQFHIIANYKQDYESDLTDEEKWRFAVEQRNSLQAIWAEEAKIRGIKVPAIRKEANQSMSVQTYYLFSILNLA